MDCGGVREGGYKFRLGMARAARCFKHICAACAIIPLPSLSFPLMFLFHRSLFHAISLPCTSRFLTFPNSQCSLSPPSPFSPLSLLLTHSLTTIQPFNSRSFSNIFSFSLVSSLSHTHSPPTGEHSPCQTRIDLTLSVPDYKSDQLGAHCACRIGIGKRSEGANAERALSLFENRYIPAQQPPTMHYRAHVRHSFSPLGN